MRYVYRVRIGREDVGRRVTVRYRTPDGRATDVIGVLEDWSEDALAVRDRRGTRVIVRAADVLAAKRVEAPSRPGRLRDRGA